MPFKPFKSFKSPKYKPKFKTSTSFKTKKKFRVGMIITLILVAILIPGVWMIETNLKPMLKLVARTEVTKFSQGSILRGIRAMQEKLGPELDDLMHIEKGTNGRITFVQIRPTIQAKIYEMVTDNVQEELKSLRDRYFRVKIGEVLQSNVLADYGPSIPIKIWSKGSTKVDIVPVMESKGINMVMVTLNIRVDNEMGVVIPLLEDAIPIKYEYPIAQSLVVGEVPQYYFYNDQGSVKKGAIKKDQGMIHPPNPHISTPASTEAN